jgi:hypothetical protein
MSSSNAPFRYGRFAVFALIAGAINLVLFFVGGALGGAMAVNSPALLEIPFFAAFGSTVTPLLIAGFITWLIGKKAPKFVNVAAWLGLVFALVSIASPLMVAVDMTTGIVLAAMHIVAGLGWFLGIKRSAN